MISVILIMMTTTDEIDKRRPYIIISNVYAQVND